MKNYIYIIVLLFSLSLTAQFNQRLIDTEWELQEYGHETPNVKAPFFRKGATDNISDLNNMKIDFKSDGTCDFLFNDTIIDNTTWSLDLTNNTLQLNEDIYDLEINTNGFILTIKGYVYNIEVDYFVVYTEIKTTPTLPTLTSIYFQEDVVTINNGDAYTYQITGTYSDGTTQDLTNDSNLNITIDDENILNQGNDNTVQAIAVGQTNINATIDVLSTAITVTVEENVTTPTLTAIAFQDNQVTLTQGDPYTYQITGTYSDGTTQDLTNDSNLNITIDDENILNQGNDNTVQAIAVGQTNINATIDALSTAITVSVEENVSTPTLTAIAFQNNQVTLTQGDSYTYQMTGTYIDGTTQDLTNDPNLNITINDENILNQGNDNTVQAIVVGQTNINATIDVLSTAITVSVEENVSTPTLTAIAFQNNQVTLTQGDPYTYQITGTYSDGTTQDITNTPEVNLTIADQNILALGTNNTIQGITPGESIVTATMNGLSSNISITITEKPSEVTLTAIAFEQSNATITEGETYTFKVLGTYSDGTQQDITRNPELSYTSQSETIIAVIGNTIQGITAGKCTVNATINELSSNIMITVTEKTSEVTLTAIAFEQSNATLKEGETYTFKVFGTYSDGTQQDITDNQELSYTLQNETSITINGNTILGIAAGESTVTATINELSSNITITVAEKPSEVTLTAIAFEENEATIKKGDNYQYHIIGTYSDDTEQDITKNPALRYTVQDETVITKVNGNTILGITAGESAITATLDDLSSILSITVEDQVIAPEDEKEKEIQLYPNPTKNTIQLSLNEAIETIALYTAEGQFIRASLRQGNTISLEQLPAGLYILKIIDKKGNTISTKKVVKQ